MGTKGCFQIFNLCFKKFEIKKLDKSRVSYEMLRSEERRVVVLDVVLVNKQIVATLPNSRELIICNLR